MNSNKLTAAKDVSLKSYTEPAIIHCLFADPMASKRIRKPPSRYVDDVESPFANRNSRVNKTQDVVVLPLKIEQTLAPKPKTETGRSQAAKMPSERVFTVKSKNVRKGNGKTGKRSKKKNMTKKVNR